MAPPSTSTGAGQTPAGPLPTSRRTRVSIDGPHRPTSGRDPGPGGDAKMKLPRFHTRTLLIAVVVTAVVLAALRHDIGRRGYAFYLLACTSFAASALIAVTARGRARLLGVAVAVASCLGAWAVFSLFGVSYSG